MKPSPIVVHSVVINGARTGITVEAPFWDVLLQIAERRGVTASQLCEAIEKKRDHKNRSSAIRLFVLSELQAQLKGAHR